LIYIIRHGQTAKNRTGTLQGRSNAPLDESGIAQARAAAGWFSAEGIHFDKVYTSPLIRAEETARILAKDVEIVTEERLIEMDYGPYEGMDLHHLPPELMVFFSDFVHNPAPHGMESLSSVVSRLGTFLTEILEEAYKYNLLLSTHAIAMKGALEYLTPGSEGRYWSKYIGNCSVYGAGVLENGYEIPRELWHP
jgi:broad specificity phosphatase PhoE